MSEGISQPDAPEVLEGEKPDLFSKFDALIKQREDLLANGVEDPFSLVMEKVLSPTRAICNGRDTILLGTYNYMGMTFDPDVIEAGKQALDDFGSGTTGSRVLNGTYQGHKEVEQALKDFYAMDHAMVFSTGYQANLGIISHHRRQGRLRRARHRQPRHRSGTAARWAMPRSCRSSTTISRRWKSGCGASPKAPASWWCSKASIRCSATSRRSRRWSRLPRNTARWCWSTKRIRWASSATTGAAWPKSRA